MQHFERQREETLLRFLDQLNVRDAVLNYAQIQGLLYAMACAPEPIKPIEWFELVWLNDDPQFEDAAEAKRFFDLLVDLFDCIAGDVQRHRYRLNPLTNIQEDSLALADWCDGFLLGHQYLEDVWNAALDRLDDDPLFERVADALDCAVTFVAGDVSDEDEELLLTEFVRFQQLLQEYCDAYLRCREILGTRSAEQVFNDMQSVPKGAVCPCGSGRFFETCCLH